MIESRYCCSNSDCSYRLGILLRTHKMVITAEFVQRLSNLLNTEDGCRELLEEHLFESKPLLERFGIHLNRSLNYPELQTAHFHSKAKDGTFHNVKRWYMG